MPQYDPKWPKITQNDPKWPKWPKMTQNGPKSPKMTKMTQNYQNGQNDQNDPKSPKMTQNDPKWPKMTKMTQNHPKWSKWSKPTRITKITRKSPWTQMAHSNPVFEFASLSSGTICHFVPGGSPNSMQLLTSHHSREVLSLTWSVGFIHYCPKTQNGP